MAATVVTVQPQVQPAMQVNPGRPWTTGLCGCTEDIKSCLCVMFCTPCFECKIASNLGENCCIPMCVPGAIIAMRTKLRTMNNIRGSICDDCCMATFLGPFVLCQMKREMTATGLWP